jgi:DNA-binding transcriptional ArsR family regulator
MDETERIDRLFQALADSTRRDIVARALTSPHSVSTLASSYAISFAAVQRHVAVLERAGLVTKQRRGREQLVTTSIETVREAQVLLDRYEQIWRDRIDRFGDMLAATTQGEQE